MLSICSTDFCFIVVYFKVHTMEKSKHSNREKRVDTSLSVTATEDLIEYKHQAGASKAIIFFTGILIKI